MELEIYCSGIKAVCTLHMSYFRVVPDCQSTYLDSSCKGITENVDVVFPDIVITPPSLLLSSNNC